MAIKLFNSIDLKKLSNNTAKIQYDYMAAYFDFYTGS